MTSKLIVNSLAADTGVSTITFADQAKMGNAIFHSTGFTIGDSFLHSTGVNITNINATGVITATKFVGEVSVGSSITFEDNEKAYFGTGTDFSIYHNGSASYLDETGTGGLIAKTNTAFQVFNSAGSQPAFTVTPGGSVDLYHNTSKVLETKAYGIDITGGFVATGDCSIADKITHAGDLNTAIRFPAADTFTVETAGTERLRIESNGDVEWNNVGTQTPGEGNNTVGMGFEPRNGTIFLSRGDNALIISNRNNDGRHIHFNQGGTGKFAIGLQNSGADLAFFSGAGNSPTEKLRIKSDGKVGVNTTSPGRMMHIFSGSTGHPLILERGDNSNTQIEIRSGGAIRGLWGGSSTANFMVYDNDASTVHFEVLQTGVVQVPDKINFNTNGSYVKENQLKFQPSGTAYIDHATTGQDIQFRTSVSSALDTSSVKITSAGNVAFMSGRGLDFSAASGLQSGRGTSTSHILDDYEEGDYTPTFTVQSGTVTLDSSTKTLSYTKIGRQVTIIGQIKVSSVSGPSGIFRASLPFTRGNQTEEADRTMCNIVVTNAAVNNANEFSNYPDGGSDSYLEIVSISGTSVTRNGGQNMQSNTYIYVNYTYFTA